MKPFARAGCANREAGKRRRAGIVTKLTVTAVAVAAMSAVAALPASAEVQAGRNLEMNHSIQLGLLEGWDLGTMVRADVFRGATLIATKTGEVGPGAKPGETEFIANHVGGGDCWEGVAPGTTPDVKPGDKFVATVLDSNTLADTADVDYVFVRDIQLHENGDGSITGHARGVENPAGTFNLAATGTPVDLVTEIMEAKRVGSTVESDFPFEPAHLDADGNFNNVAVGGTPGEGELFIDHLTEAGGGTGTTTAFRDTDPPEIPCGPIVTTAFTSNSHPVINLANVGTDMVIGGPKEAAVAVTATFNGQPVAVVDNGDGTWSATIPAADLQALPDGSSNVLVASFSDGSPDQTRNVLKDVTAPVLSASPAPGTYSSSQAVALTSNGGEEVRFTQDGSVPTNTSRLYDGTRVALGTGSHTIRAFSVDAAGNRSDATFSYTITAPAGAAAGGAAGGAVGGAGAGGAAGGGAAGDVLARITGLRAIRLTLAQARRRGVTVSFNVPEGARFVRVTLFRQTNASRHNTRRLVVRRAFAVSRSGRHTFRINDRRTRRKLVRGRYVIQVAPGVSDSSFQEATAKRFTIR